MPVYHHIHLKTDNLDEIAAKLTTDMNLRNPIAFHLEHMTPDQQREIIGVIENYFDAQNVSFEFPYPIYLIATVEKSSTGMPVVKTQNELPRFFLQKEGRMNVKETHLVLKNKLLHQEIRNVDSSLLRTEIEKFAETHREIYELETEMAFYQDLLNKLKGKKRG